MCLIATNAGRGEMIWKETRQRQESIGTVTSDESDTREYSSTLEIEMRSEGAGKIWPLKIEEPLKRKWDFYE